MLSSFTCEREAFANPSPLFFFSPLHVFCSLQTRVGPFSDLPSCDRQVSFLSLRAPPPSYGALSFSPQAVTCSLTRSFPSPLSLSLSLPLSLTTQSRNLLIPSGAMSSCSGPTPVPGCPSMAQYAVAETEMFPQGGHRMRSLLA